MHALSVRQLSHEHGGQDGNGGQHTFFFFFLKPFEAISSLQIRYMTIRLI